MYNSISDFKDNYSPVRSHLPDGACPSRHVAGIVSYGEAEWNFYLDQLRSKYFQSTREDFEKLKKLAESI